MLLTSPETSEITAALCAAYPDFAPIVKDKWNPFFKSYYAELPSIRKSVNPALTKHGLFLAQAFNADGARVTVVTRLSHKSGQWLEGHSSANAKDGSTQAVAAASTYLCRNAVTHLLSLELGEDDDGNSSVEETGHRGGSLEPPPPARTDLIANPADVFDMQTMQGELAGELKTRGIPETAWEAVGKKLHGKDKRLLSKTIAEVMADMRRK